jgi:hypothetical protein
MGGTVPDECGEAWCDSLSLKPGRIVRTVESASAFSPGRVSRIRVNR